MPEPLVTIVIPTYNRKTLLKQSVASVQAQTFTDWELIVADDGSNDGTSEWVLSINDKRIKVIDLTHSGNIAAVRNEGARAGSAKWVAFLDSDDLWVPGKLEIQLNLLREKNQRWCYGGYELIDEQGRMISNKMKEYQPVSGCIIRRLLKNEVAVDVGSVLIERKLFEELGGFDTDPRLFCREDYEFTLRLALKAEGLAVPRVLYRIREHGGRSTKGLGNGYEFSAFVYEHFISTCDDKQLKKIARREWAHELAEASVKNMQLGNRSKAINQLIEAAKKGDSIRHLLSSVQHYFFKRRRGQKG